VETRLVAILGAALAACSSQRKVDPVPAVAPPVTATGGDAGPAEAVAAVAPVPPAYEVLATGLGEITSIAVTGRRVVLGDGDRVLELPKAAGGTPAVALALGHHDGEITFDDHVGYSGGSHVAAWGEEAIAGRVVVRGKRPVVELLRVSRPRQPIASRAPAYGASSFVVVGDALFWQAHLLPGPGPLVRTDLKTGRSQTVISLPMNWYTGPGQGWLYATDGRVVVQLEIEIDGEHSVLHTTRIAGGEGELWRVEGEIRAFAIAGGAVYALVSGEQDGVWRVPLDRTPPAKLPIDNVTNVFARGDLAYVATYEGLVAVRGTAIGKVAPGDIATPPTILATDETHAYWVEGNELRRTALPPAP
jgi:hypothetical protein